VILSGFNHDQKTPKIQRYHPANIGRSNRGFDWNGEGAVMKKYVMQFRIETNGGKLIAYAASVEEAEYWAGKGRNRWIFRWFEGRYCCARQVS